MLSILFGMKQCCFCCFRIILADLSKAGILVFFEVTSPILSVKEGHRSTENKNAGVRGKLFLTLLSELFKAVIIKLRCLLEVEYFAVSGNKYCNVLKSNREYDVILKKKMDLEDLL